MKPTIHAKRWTALGATAIVGMTGAMGSAQAQMSKEERMDKAREWVNKEFAPGSISKEQMMKEMEFFIEASKPYRGMDVEVLSETIATHVYESNKLAKAFSEITGINLTHDITGEGEVVSKVQTELQSERTIYDAYINDSDLIGTHYRYGKTVPLSKWMKNGASDVTSPYLDVDDFMGKSFTTAPNGVMYQLPDQQFANLYWFRHDWFQNEELQERFKDEYGYDLGVPKNWSAYEDIAEFFTEQVSPDDVANDGGADEIYGHMDYGKKDPSLAWRFHDAWLSMAGAGDKGLPNGKPVDEWGIRVEDCHPVGSTVARGGAVNGPAAVYSMRKYLKWLNEYAPPDASGMTFSEAGPIPANGKIAQQIFWYTAFTASMTAPEKAVATEEGKPRWRMAPSPKGPYWEEGMKLGYQDAGSWTFFKHTAEKNRKAAWLYAQFVTSKTVSVKKFKEGLTPVRESTIESEEVGDMSEQLGGLVEFYRSPARVQWTPTGTNPPDYPKLASLWWQNIAPIASGNVSPQEGMTKLGKEMDQVMQRLERAGVQERCGPRMNEKRDPEYWLSKEGAPKAKLDNENPQGKTVAYEELVKSWQEE
jgi:glycerol transport system substrate-binding protein